MWLVWDRVAGGSRRINPSVMRIGTALVTPPRVSPHQQHTKTIAAMVDNYKDGEDGEDGGDGGGDSVAMIIMIIANAAAVVVQR